MKAAEIAALLGGAHRSSGWWRCVCPVHGSRSGRSATLALRDADRGLVVHCHALCDPRDVLAELHRRRLIESQSGATQPSAPSISSLARTDNDTRRIALARRIWDRARDARQSPVVDYLASRGITIPPPPSLRWAPACRHPSGIFLPAMVARVEHVERGFVGCHRTYLTGDYHRLDRATLGPVGGGAVRLAPATETLLIGEGIETVMAAMQATAMPGSAALSTSGMVALVLPPIVRAVVILADHDRSGAGERAARTAAQRWLAEGRRVWIAMPPEPGTDFADVLAGRGYARIEEFPRVAA